jgi:hypothetical protein
MKDNLMKSWVRLNFVGSLEGRWELFKIKRLSIRMSKKAVTVKFSGVFGPYFGSRTIGELSRDDVQKAWRRNIVPKFKRHFDDVSLAVTSFRMSKDNKTMIISAVTTMTLKRPYPWWTPK